MQSRDLFRKSDSAVRVYWTARERYCPPFAGKRDCATGNWIMWMLTGTWWAREVVLFFFLLFFPPSCNSRRFLKGQASKNWGKGKWIRLCLPGKSLLWGALAVGLLDTLEFLRKAFNLCCYCPFMSCYLKQREDVPHLLSLESKHIDLFLNIHLVKRNVGLC